MSTATVEQVIEALRPVQDPELHRSIVDLDMVRDIAISSQGISLTITLTIAGCPMRNEIQGLVTNDMTHLDDPRKSSLYCAFLNVQGRVLADSVVFSDGPDAFVIDCDALIAPMLLKHLKMYSSKSVPHL